MNFYYLMILSLKMQATTFNEIHTKQNSGIVVSYCSLPVSSGARGCANFSLSAVLPDAKNYSPKFAAGFNELKNDQQKKHTGKGDAEPLYIRQHYQRCKCSRRQ